MSRFSLGRPFLSGLLILALALVACRAEEPGIRVDLGKTNPGEKHVPDLPRKDALRIAVAAMITPRETMDIYQQIVDYLGEELGRPVELVQRKTYAEVNDLLRQRLAEAAFVCTQAYVEGNRDFGLELVAAPMVKGKATYSSYLIVPRSSTVKSLKEIRGKSFAFTDPMSASGRLVPTFLLAQMGETPDSFFSNYVFTYGHSNSIRSVAHGIVDGAAVDSLVWDYANETDPTYTSRTRIIYRSESMGSPPVVVHSGLDPDLKAKIKTALLGMHEEERGRNILSRAMIDRFVTPDDGAYDSIREMMNYLDGRRAVVPGAPGRR